jgi:hypothetical protein
MQIFKCNDTLGIILDRSSLGETPSKVSKFVTQAVNMRERGELVKVVILPDGCQHVFMTNPTVVMIRDEMKILSDKVKYVFV